MAPGTEVHEELNLCKMPEQPQFDAYIRSRGIDPEHFYSHRQNQLAQKMFEGNNPTNVDVLRLSHNVKKNMNSGQDYSGNNKDCEEIGTDDL